MMREPPPTMLLATGGHIVRISTQEGELSPRFWTARFLEECISCGARFSEDDPGRAVPSIRNFEWGRMASCLGACQTHRNGLSSRQDAILPHSLQPRSCSRSIRRRQDMAHSNYSYLKATIGSTREARRAGIYPAKADT